MTAHVNVLPSDQEVYHPTSLSPISDSSLADGVVLQWPQSSQLACRGQEDVQLLARRRTCVMHACAQARSAAPLARLA